MCMFVFIEIMCRILSLIKQKFVLIFSAAMKISLICEHLFYEYFGRWSVNQSSLLQIISPVLFLCKATKDLNVYIYVIKLMIFSLLYFLLFTFLWSLNICSITHVVHLSIKDSVSIFSYIFLSSLLIDVIILVVLSLHEYNSSNNCHIMSINTR